MRTSVVNSFQGIEPDEISKHCKTPYCDCNPEVDHEKFNRFNAQIFTVSHKPLPKNEAVVYDEVIINADLEPAFV